MNNESWKELMKHRDLYSQLLWLVNSYDRYLRENHDKWESLKNASRITENYKEAIDYNNREGDAQKERYEWLLQYISENYTKKSFGERPEDLDKCYSTIGALIQEKVKLEKEIERLNGEIKTLDSTKTALEKSLIFERGDKDILYNMSLMKGDKDER